MKYAASFPLLLLSAACAASAEQPAFEYEELGHEEAEARARACGFEQVDASYEEYLQSDELRISDPTITDEQLSCLASAMDLTLTIVSVPPEYMRPFSHMQSELALPRMMPKLLVSLEKDGFGPPPPYIPSEMTEGDYAATLEAHCGPEAEGAFSSEYGPTTISPAWMTFDGLQSKAKMAAFSCITTSVMIAGFPLRFIGNEKLSDK